MVKKSGKPTLDCRRTTTRMAVVAPSTLGLSNSDRDSLGMTGLSGQYLEDVHLIRSMDIQ